MSGNTGRGSGAEFFRGLGLFGWTAEEGVELLVEYEAITSVRVKRARLYEHKQHGRWSSRLLVWKVR
jgi:hypothetical protein